MEQCEARRAVACGSSARSSGSSGSRALVGLDHDEAVLGEERGDVRGEYRLERVEHPVGRVDEDEIVATARGRFCGERAPGVRLDDPRAGQAELLEVALDRALRLAVGLDEHRGRGSAGERLEPHRTGAGEQVEHRHLVDGPDQVERRLADPVSGRTRLALGREDPRPFPATRDDPHASALARIRRMSARRPRGARPRRSAAPRSRRASRRPPRAARGASGRSAGA